MNNFSLYTFRLYHYLLTLRDTMEYTIKRDHKVEVYENRKKILTENLEEGTPFGDFLKNNGEAGDKIREKVQEFIKNLYSEESTILVPAGELVRVDVAQSVTLFDMTVGLTETLRDIVYQYIAYGQNNKEIDPMIVGLVSDDERMYRIVLSMLVMRSFEESFAEFQKVMGESQGKPTPQSNFIVQNELSKYANLLRFVRSHNHCTDNETLDALDKCLQVVEMSEGRRDRRDNKNFPDLFKEALDQVNALLVLNGPKWQEAFNKALKEMLEDIKKNSNKSAQA